MAGPGQSFGATDSPWFGLNSKLGGFVDEAFARSVWSGVKTRAELEALEARHCGAPSVAAMREKHPGPEDQKTYVEYARNNVDPTGDLGKCIDIRAAKSLYGRAYFQAQRAAFKVKPYPAQWPPVTETFCTKYKELYVLGASCSDIPDWREDNRKAKDAERAARKD